MIMGRLIYLLLFILVLGACSRKENWGGVISPEVPQIVTQSLIVNPTKISPLTASMNVKTDIETKVSILVKGQDGEDLTHDFNEFSCSHVIPILGLYMDYENEVVITLTSRCGGQLKVGKQIKTDSVPWLDIKEFEPVASDWTTVGDGFVMLHLAGTDGIGGRVGSCPVMLDKFGKIRWLFFSEIMNHVFKKLSNGHYLVDGIGTGFWEVDLLGVKYGYWAAPEGVHHDAVETSDHTILFLSHADGSTDDGVIELDLADGSYINKWDLRNILDVNRPQMPTNGLDRDWLHLNGIDFQKQDNSFIVSGRNQSAVVKIDRDTGKLRWILGNHEYWTDSLKPYLLTPVGGDFEWQWGQHAPVFHPKDPSRILLFDNGCDRSYSNSIPAAQNYSRVVEYKIDEVSMTVSQVWQFGKEYGSELYSSYISNACYLNNGNVLICYGGLTKNTNGEAVELGDPEACNFTRILEIVPSTHEVVWDLNLSAKDDPRHGFRSYRAYKIDMYN